MIEINELNQKFFDQKNEANQKLQNLQKLVIKDGLPSMEEQTEEKFRCLTKDLGSRL